MWLCHCTSITSKASERLREVLAFLTGPEADKHDGTEFVCEVYSGPVNLARFLLSAGVQLGSMSAFDPKFTFI
jgi:hypothetical protein